MADFVKAAYPTGDSEVVETKPGYVSDQSLKALKIEKAKPEEITDEWTEF